MLAETYGSTTSLGQLESAVIGLTNEQLHLNTKQLTTKRTYITQAERARSSPQHKGFSTVACSSTYVLDIIKKVLTLGLNPAAIS